MNTKNKVIITYGLWLTDVVTMVISFILAMYIRFGLLGNRGEMRNRQTYYMVGLTCVLLATMYSFFIAWNSDFMRRKWTKELSVIIKMNAVVAVATVTAMFLFKWADLISRWMMGYFFVINIPLTLIAHLIFRQCMRAYYSSDLVKTKVLVVTQPELKDIVLERLNSNLDMSYQIVDVKLTDEIGDAFYENATTMAFDEVFLYAPEWSQKLVNRLVYYFYDMGVKCNYCVELADIDENKSYTTRFGNYSVITYNQSQGSYKKLLVKRLVDIVGGIVGSLITIVFTPFVALAIKLDSKGPVFFSQTRIGRNGRRFKIYKFRSMYTDAEERKKELESQNEVNGLMFKMENDPRITKVGRFIRKTSIDELPQFFNIVKGDMSLVGTRPPTEDEFAQYNEHYRRRLSITPGLTGLWQVSGRSDIDDFDDVVKLDLEYIDHWSLKLDAKILLKTVAVVFTGRGSK